jgi:hypothetical protein
LQDVQPRRDAPICPALALFVALFTTGAALAEFATFG